MGLLGFDAATLINHEFDYRSQGLTDILNSAAASGDRLPAVTITNIDWERTLTDKDRAETAAELKATMERCGVSDYVIMEKGGIKAAIFLPDASRCGGEIFRPFKNHAQKRKWYTYCKF